MDRSCIDSIVNKSEQMQKDGTGHKKAEAIIWFQDHAFGMLPSEYQEYKNLFLNWCCMEDDDPYNRYKIPCDKDMPFDDLITNFKKWCDLVSKFGDTSMLDTLEENADETDKIFVTLVRLVHTFIQATKAIHLTAQEIADAVLKRMVDYYENIFFRSSMTIEEEVLDSLIHQFCGNHATA